ncbi:hypothetical protein BHU72_01215 [Desulfuribacillus stibiiarsenatis]|uniref:Uncharacterized protein n=1 Tax=Desulfuribacillus stibiiarsenatis TaxID=1390249 RepID=A0A1E5L9U7_9FIRM|nr:B12-binding domain-containing radical SAM protein [Desulfuribacillus stibiiarsenatis]OEH86910.1 hypothetical protein BHU72_01215 [Desulfuribacillus stibiiarsenatis]
MKKIVLVSLNAKYIHTNLAIRYLETYYREHYNEQYPVEFVRKEYTINQQLADIVADLYLQKADVIGFSCYIWNVDSILKVIRNFKKVAPRVKIVLGGPEVSFDSKERMLAYPEIDYIICGEGEDAFAKLMLTLDLPSTELQDTLIGISYRDPISQEIIEAKQQVKIKELAKIPSPYGDNFDPLDFQYRIIYYESSRGCPYSCQYCLSSTDQGVRFFPIEQVKSDLKKFIEAKVKQVKFVDRTFNCAPKYAMDLFRWIIEHQQGFTNFHFEISADLLTDEMLEFLKGAPLGLFQFEIGVQSTHDQTLDAIQRKMDFQKLKEAVLRLQEGANIHQHLDLIVGLPHEDFQRFAQSFDDVYKLQPDKLQMGFLKVLKGSGMRMREQEYGFIYMDEPPYEILQTNDLTYDDVILLRDIEHILDHYYNSHQFTHTLAYLIAQEKSPFEFYERFAQYASAQGFFEKSHSQGAMYDFLFAFVSATSDSNDAKVSIVRDFMKFDFVRLSPHGKLPDVLHNYTSDDLKKKKQVLVSDPTVIEQYYPQYAQLNMRNLSKYVQIESFQYDIMNTMEQRTTYYLFVYHDDPLNFKRADWYDVTEQIKQI